MDLWEHESKLPSVNFKVEYVGITGDIVTALILSQIVYWFRPGKNGKPKLSVEREGKWWLAKSHKDWEQECGVSRKQLARALGILEEKGLIVVELHRFNGSPTSHVGLKVDALLSVLLQHDCDLSAQSDATKGNNGLCSKGTLHQHLSAQTLGKTTTETTAEITTSTESQATADALENTGVLEMATAVEVLEQFKSKPLKAGDKESLTVKWKKEYAGMYTGFAPGLTLKEVGQLSQVGKKVGKEAALKCIEFVVRDWQGFTWTARADKGLATVPEKPVIGFLLSHLNTAMSMLVDDEAKKTGHPMADSPQLIAAAVTGLDKPETLCDTPPIEKPQSIAATPEQLQAALAALSKLGDD